MKNKFKWVLLFISFIFMVFGVARGEAVELMKKAINICLECIGIG